MNRRKFLTLVGGGIVIAAGGGYAATRTPTKALEPWGQAGTYTDTRLNALSYAILAPNPHNRQPWTIELVGGDTVLIGFDENRQLPHTDPFDRQLTIGMGCFLELLVMAANASGYDVDLELFPEGVDDKEISGRLVAIARFIKSDAIVADPLFAHVLERRSTKESHDMAKPVPVSALETLIAAGQNNTQMGGTVAEEELAYWRQATIEAMEIELDTPRTYKESVDLFRIGKSEINANPDGIELPGLMMDVMGATGLMSREAALDPESIAFTSGKEVTLAPMKTSMGFLWMTTPDNSRLSQIAAGRDWVRANLAATSIGLAYHPNSQCLQEYAEMQKHYDDVHSRLAPNGGTVQMLIRIGYCAKVGPTPRWPLESRIVGAKTG
ncbi:MAG: twin-arginine translocation pathway signal protein [Pseudomonadota bacterium]